MRFLASALALSMAASFGVAAEEQESDKAENARQLAHCVSPVRREVSPEQEDAMDFPAVMRECLMRVLRIPAKDIPVIPVFPAVENAETQAQYEAQAKTYGAFLDRHIDQSVFGRAVSANIDESLHSQLEAITRDVQGLSAKPGISAP